MMSNTEELKNYLIDEADGFLLNDDNNGKTIMLSGAWGAGKTHFWQKIIEPKLSEKLKEDYKACVYVSLYGKDSLDDIKQEIFLKASTENDYLSDDIEAFGYRALSSISDTDGIIGTLFKTAIDLNEYRKHGKGENKLKHGGLICFDDFERKSKEIDLNDLFGFISQLAIVLKCKVVIILNSDVFEGEEANVFKNVKEKTVNKYFHFEPTPKELYYSVANDEKYNKLNEYKEEILKAILETEELNARIYIQVLDNCWEWVDKGYDGSVMRVLSLVIINFMKNHFVFDYRIIDDKKRYKIIDEFIEYYEIASYLIRVFPQRTSTCGCDEIIHTMKTSINKIKEKDDTKSEDYYIKINEVFENNKNIFRALFFHIYQLKIDQNIDKEIFLIINNFVKTGILPKQTKEVESLLPLEIVTEIEV